MSIGALKRPCCHSPCLLTRIPQITNTAVSTATPRTTPDRISSKSTTPRYVWGYRCVAGGSETRKFLPSRRVGLGRSPRVEVVCTPVHRLASRQRDNSECNVCCGSLLFYFLIEHVLFWRGCPNGCGAAVIGRQEQNAPVHHTRLADATSDVLSSIIALIIVFVELKH